MTEKNINSDHESAHVETVFSDSATVHSFGALSAAGEGDLAGQLEDVGVLVEKSDSEEAAQLFECLLEEVSHKRRAAPIRSLWSGLVEVLPKASEHVYDGSALEALVLLADSAEQT